MPGAKQTRRAAVNQNSLDNLLKGGMPGNRGGTGAIKNMVRALARQGAEDAAPYIIAIAKGDNEKAKPADSVAAFSALVRVGIGEITTLVLESGVWLPIVAEVAAKNMTKQQFEEFWPQLMETLNSTKSQ
jgi:hypothetical protein